MRYIITQSEEELWTVGQGTPGSDRTWQVHSDHGSLTEAEECAAELNGIVTPARLEAALADMGDRYDRAIEGLREKINTLENRLDEIEQRPTNPPAW